MRTLATKIRMVGFAALGLSACANSHQLEAKAQDHSARAQTAAATGSYNVAQAEKEKAEKYHNKAIKKSLKEGNANEVSLPAEPPLPPPPEPPAHPVETLATVTASSADVR